MNDVIVIDKPPARNSALIIHAQNPFNNKERTVSVVPVGTELLSMVPKTDAAMICIINGEPIHRANWDCVLEDGDIVVFKNLPAGGGDSNPLQVILGIILIVVGIVVFFYGGDGSYFIAAGVGLLAAGALVPTTKAPLALQPVEAPSPTYGLALAGNTARLGQPLPVIYGRHILFPDFAAQPYTEYENNDAFYHALLCLGHSSDVNIESITIDDTAIGSFQEVQTQLQGRGFATLQTLVSPIVVNAPEVSGDQRIEEFRAVGPFAAVGPGVRTSRIAIDIFFPKGLYYANDAGGLGEITASWIVQARTINDLGAPSGAWITLGSESYTDNDSTPQRRSYNYTVPSARYEVRVSRVDVRNTNARAGHDITWGAMRAYVDAPAPLEPGGLYLALRIRATSQLSGSSSRRVAVIQRRRLPRWNPMTGWSAPVETRSIAWAFADVLRNPDYGYNVEDARIDLQSLYDLDLVWTARGDTFNGVIDKRMTLWAALTTIARAGRARPILRGNVFTIVRDSQQELPVAMFNMRNIKRGTFSMEYATVTEDTPDAVELEFFNEITWSTDSVVVPLPGITEPELVAKGSILGVTSRRQIIREAAYTAAAAAYRTQTIRFETEMEGFLPSYGDLVAVSHDVPDWGVSAEVEEVALPLITISEPVPWTAVQHYAMMVNDQGDVFGPYRVAPGPTERQVLFIDTPGMTPYVGTDRERTRVAIGAGVNFMRYCRVTSINPKNNSDISITAIVEDNRVHEYDAAYLSQFTEPRPAYFMRADAPNYNVATLEQRSGRGGWATRADGTVGAQGDTGYIYQ